MLLFISTCRNIQTTDNVFGTTHACIHEYLITNLVFRSQNVPVTPGRMRRGCERTDYPVVSHLRLRAHVGTGENNRAAADAHAGTENHAVALDLRTEGHGGTGAEREETTWKVDEAGWW